MSDFHFEVRAKLEHQDGCPCKGSSDADAYKQCDCDVEIRSVWYKDLPAPQMGGEWVSLPFTRSEP